MYKYNHIIQFIAQLIMSYGVFLFLKINPSFIILDFNLFNEYIPSGIIDTFISLKEAGGDELANSFLVVFLLNMIIYVFYIILIISSEWKFKKIILTKKQDKEIGFIINIIFYIYNNIYVCLFPCIQNKYL